MSNDTVPLFLLGVHRGGTTYVQRLLNAHRDVVLWGENGGLVSNLRRAFDHTHEIQTVDEARFRAFDDLTSSFLPWAAPFDRAELIRVSRVLLETLYRRDDVRYWGFKEIRHGNAADMTFLRSMFPCARLVTLIRHPRDVLLSELQVSWQPPVARRNHPLYVERFLVRYGRAARAFVADQRSSPDLARLCIYEDMTDPAQIRALFAWLGLDPDESDEERIRIVQSARVGSSYRDVTRPLDEAAVAMVKEQFAAAVPSFLDNLADDLRQEMLAWYPDLAKPTDPSVTP